MLSPKFYLLIGALESARAFIERHYRDLLPYPAASPRPEFGVGDDAGDNAATGDPHLDPDPGTAGQAAARLPLIRDALLNAEGDLSVALYAARNEPDAFAADQMRSAAWTAFCDSVTTQSFVLARVVRRLKWVDQAPADPANPNAGTGAPEWEMMDQRLRRILKAFAELSLGGGEDNPALNGPGILGSSDESISF
jgi:hypothetical protein